jgi:hypothetical protein
MPRAYGTLTGYELQIRFRAEARVCALAIKVKKKK